MLKESLLVITAESTRDGLRDYDHLYRMCIDEAPVSQMFSLLDDLAADGCLINEGGAQSSAPHIEGGQVWIGSYLCGQGDTDLQLEITGRHILCIKMTRFHSNFNRKPAHLRNSPYSLLVQGFK